MTDNPTNLYPDGHLSPEQVLKNTMIESGQRIYTEGMSMLEQGGWSNAQILKRGTHFLNVDLDDELVYEIRELRLTGGEDEVEDEEQLLEGEEPHIEEAEPHPDMEEIKLPPSRHRSPYTGEYIDDDGEEDAS